MLVSRWGILRRPLSSAMGIRKIVALVICLCRLHNFCINRRIKERNAAAAEEEDIAPPTARDAMEIAGGGGIPLERVEEHNRFHEASPEQLLHGGEHHDDTTPEFRRQFERRNVNTRTGTVPRDKLLSAIVNGGFKRKVPESWLGKK